MVPSFCRIVGDVLCVDADIVKGSRSSVRVCVL